MKKLYCIIYGGFLKSTEQSTTYHLPTDQPTPDQMHRSPTNQPPTNKKFEDQKFYDRFKMDN